MKSIYVAKTKKAELVFRQYIKKKHRAFESITVIEETPLTVEVIPSLDFIKKQNKKAMRVEGLTEKDYSLEVIP